jgi:hypothetical protein
LSFKTQYLAHRAVFRVILPVILPALGWTQVFVSPGDNVQPVVDASPAGTVFIFGAGTYRLQSIQPKDNDTFIGGAGAILSGAELLTTFSQENGLYVVTGQGQQGQQNGACDAQHPQCTHPEDLFFDSSPLVAVGTLASVGPGTWYFDYPDQKIYFADDPTGHTVETSVARSAFSGSATNVTIMGFTIEKYAIPGQFGAVGDQYPGPNWIVSNNEVRWNHGAGINLGSGSSAINNYVHHNGQKGVTADGQNVLVQGNEISFNNWAGFDPAWEAGGSKFAQMNFLTVRGNFVHDNVGPGIWCDVDCINVLIENNVVVNNTAGAGIQYEISFAATIRNNQVRGNYVGTSGWLWGSQILIQNSRDVAVYGNKVESSVTSGNGIGIIQQDRGSGPYGPRISANDYIHHNTITHRGTPGADGEVADFNSDAMVNTQNNVFDYNSYHVTDLNAWHWYWGWPQQWAGLQQLGQEAHGTIDTNIPPAQ